MPISPIFFTSPLADELIFESMSVTSGLSMLGETHVTLLSENGDLVPEDLLGKPVDLKIELADGSFRHINAYVARFGLGRQRGRHFGYQATLRPWLWFLTRTSDCRIFQEKTVPDIVKAVFEDHGIARFEFSLFRSYATRTYCVQYRESDFNFVARLLEEEGIYWYFEHTEAEHKLILVDSLSSHDPVPNFDKLPYYDTQSQVPPGVAFISNWTFTREVKSGTFALRDFDFERPSALVDAQADLTRVYDLSDKEVFDYPGLFLKSAVGKQLAENRLDEAQAGYQVVKATSIAQGLTTGHTVELEKHPREDQNIKYLLTHVDIQAQIDGNEGGSEHSGAFNCQIVAIPAAQQFRPPRTTRKPFVQGPQTAIVTGQPGEEIDTDEYGRIKVKFHWDRIGKNDQTSSCWIRVAQIWAGKNFGGIHIPRIGQEVIVDFLEGDPDQPIVTGRVYNREQMPPWNLPENKTQSGILSRSSLGGAYEDANAIRFEDKKGSEQVWIQAQKDMSTVVENDNAEIVMHDRSRTVKNHETIVIGKGREVTIEEKGETVIITGPRSFKLTGHEDEVVTDGRKINITGTNEEYTTGDRKMWTSGKFAFKAESGAFFNGTPELFATAVKVEVKSGANMFVEAGATANFKAAAFKFASMGNYDFTGIKFNRTIVEGNDVVTGKNSNCYLGTSLNVAMGQSTDVYMGMANSAAAGLAAENFLGMSMSNSVMSISNELISIGNCGLSLGMNILDLGVAGISLENNAMKLLSGGGPGSVGPAQMLSGAGAAALMAAVGGGAFALGFGAAATSIALEQAQAEVKALIATEGLTQETKDRLQRIADNPFRRASSADLNPSEAEGAAQAAALADLTPGATPADDPSAGLSGPDSPPPGTIHAGGA